MQADAEREVHPPDHPELPERPWARSGEDVVDALGSRLDGLAETEVEDRFERFGPNRLRRMDRKSVGEILWDQIKSLIMGLLVGAMAVSLVFGHTVDAIAIAAVIVVNTAIGFFTEWRAVRSMEALRKLSTVEARVRRDGSEQVVPGEDLVPGDIVLLRRGDVIAADLRLLEVDAMEIDESALTGESVPVAKMPDAIESDTVLADRACMAYKGTAVSRGTGEGIVVATGMQTELGEISSMVEVASDDGTPLEKKLVRLGRRLVWLTVAVAAAVIAAGVGAGRDLYLMVETGIALAVAAIPEGLPIVATVALAHGLWRMLRRNALIRKLSSVETLGATTIICTDKTGTLTENRMTVRVLDLSIGAVEVSRESDERLQVDDADLDEEGRSVLQEALHVAVLCNAAVLGDGEAEGDPLEVALLELGREAGLERDELLAEMPVVREEPFNRETKMMATLHRLDGGHRVLVKGAPEAVLKHCTHVMTAEGREEAAGDLKEWHDRYEALTEDGLRVLTLARKSADGKDSDAYSGLTLIGHVGLYDPPRMDVREMIERCQDAGIEVVMVTGDHPSTARSVARAVGLVRSDGDQARVIRGEQFVDPESTSEERQRRLLDALVVARVSPEQKLKLVEAHRSSGHVVAMTGDGVNDAPALRSADIGVAMGRRGTDVAKEAADMVLQDDAFSTIVAAVEQGRVIFENIRKFVIYLLSGNVGEILLVGAAAVAGMPMPLLPLQILYINLLNDVFPALALGVGGSSGEVMERPPRDPREAVITRRGWLEIVGYGVVIAAAVLGVFSYALYGLELDTTSAVTISFLGLSVTRLVHVFNMRRADSGPVRNEITRNVFVWVAIAVCTGLLLVAVYVPFLADLLSVAGPGLRDWLLVLAASLIPLLSGQAYLFIRSRLEGSRSGNGHDASYR